MSKNEVTGSDFETNPSRVTMAVHEGDISLKLSGLPANTKKREVTGLLGACEVTQISFTGTEADVRFPNNEERNKALGMLGRHASIRGKEIQVVCPPAESTDDAPASSSTDQFVMMMYNVPKEFTKVEIQDTLLQGKFTIINYSSKTSARGPIHFVGFSTDEDLQQAISMTDGKPLLGKIMKTQVYHRRRVDVVPPYPEPIEEYDGFKIIVKNLPPVCSEEDITDILSRSRCLLKDIKMNVLKRICFVDFTSENAMQNGIKALDKSELRGNTLYSERARRRQSHPHPHPVVPPYPDGPIEEREPTRGYHKLYMCQVPHDINQSDMTQFLPGRIKIVKFVARPSGNGQPICFVDFESDECLQEAILLTNGKTLRGKKMQTSKAIKHDYTARPSPDRKGDSHRPYRGGYEDEN